MSSTTTRRRTLMLDVVAPGFVALCFYVILIVQLLYPLGFNASGLIRIGDRFDGSRFWTDTTVVQDGIGYDGQFFFYIANDPALRAEDPERFLDYPAYRYGRILYPTLVWLAALGRPEALPWAMLIVNVAAAVLGTIASALVLRRVGVTGWGSLLFAYNPSMIVGVIGDLAEPTTLALMAAGFALHLYGRHGLSAVSLACAGLAREQAALVPIGLIFDAIRQRAWKQAATYCGALGVLLSWHLWVWHRLGSLPAAQNPGAFSLPFSGPLYRAGVLLGLRPSIVDETPVPNPVPELALVIVSVICIVIGLLYILKRRDVVTRQLWLQAVLTVFTSPVQWVAVASYVRPLGPLYLALGLALVTQSQSFSLRHTLFRRT